MDRKPEFSQDRNVIGESRRRTIFRDENLEQGPRQACRLRHVVAVAERPHSILPQTPQIPHTFELQGIDSIAPLRLDATQIAPCNQPRRDLATGAGRVGCLDEMAPLALMIRPPGPSPHHSNALVVALTGVRASKPLPLVHITSLAPSISASPCGENSLCRARRGRQSATGRSSYWPPLVISTKTIRRPCWLARPRSA
jgi:hypothetical protein